MTYRRPGPGQRPSWLTEEEWADLQAFDAEVEAEFQEATRVRPPHRESRVPEVQRKAMAYFVAQGMPIAEVARQYGETAAVVRCAVRRYKEPGRLWEPPG